MRTPSGRQLASDASDEIAQACMDTVQPDQLNQVDVLGLLNDIFLTLESNSLRVGYDFARHGFQLAMSLDAYPAARRYLSQCFAHPPNNSTTLTDKELKQHQRAAHEVAANLWLLMTSVVMPQDSGAGTAPPEEAAASAGDMEVQPLPYLLSPTPNSLHTAIYGLLTGRELVSTGRGSSSSIQDILVQGRDDIKLLETPYLLLLADLGAVRTLWHELHRVVPEGQGRVVSSAMSCALRLVLRNLQLGHVQFSPDSPSITQATGRYDDDCALDLESIAMASYTPDEAFPYSGDTIALYASSPVAGMDYRATRMKDRGLTEAMGERIIHAFSEPDIERSMKSIQELIEEGRPDPKN